MRYLIRNAEAILAQGISSSATDLRIADGIITEIGQGLLPQEGEQQVDASRSVIYPGFINTHHHLAQSALKGIPAGINQGLGEWLASVPYRFWPHIDPELMLAAAKMGLAEQLRSGATTCADHHYLYHLNSSMEMEDVLWQAADELGMRLVLCRGGATVQGSHKGLAKAGVKPETLELMLQRLEQTRSRYHQAESNAMRRLVVSPTSLVHSITAEDLKQVAAYARSHDLKLHSHLLEVGFDEQQAQALHGCTAVEYAQRCDWLGEDVWFAHLVQATEQDIQLLSETGTGIAHCPTSNCRLGSGIAPVVAMEKAGMPVTLGVDGSASAESGSVLQEANLAWLIHRTQQGPDATRLETVLEWASDNAAKMLGLDALGALAVGKAADLVIYDLNDYRFAGVHDRQWAPLMCGEPMRIKASFVNGRQVVEGGEVSGLDTEALQQDVIEGIQRLYKKVDA
ncbi:amidohydrolase family protein [Marinobacterium stanieri]|uniref:Cytosine/adenosine deaminase n=1 Tax=Marinobacterium stanieri TaxID=49186 RepID=A0A1N6NXY8_9GAMM|nr:amidohydrolase family protein [Marinobacterium stanieri]SIP96867.1 Cytosine/adenosine deaminase [Marinobacterium stanieri]